MRHISIFSIFIYIWFLLGCGGIANKDKKDEISFFYWKSIWDLDAKTKIWLDSTGVNKIYIRFFDIDFVNGKGAIPIAPLRNFSTDFKYDYTPTVFMTNETFIKIKNKADLKQLAFKMARKLFSTDIYNENKVNEWLIDCDWTGKTKENYFLFLQYLKLEAKSKNIEVWTTIRLDQYKNFENTGVPPVNKGVLMSYNMDDLDQWETKNSILNQNDAHTYLSNPRPYPIPLILGLPYFQWGTIFRDESLIQLINGLTYLELSDLNKFKPLGENRFEVLKSNYLKGYYLYQADKIRIEKVDSVDLWNIKPLLENWNVVNRNHEMVFFHLNDQIIKGVKPSFFKGFSKNVTPK